MKPWNPIALTFDGQPIAGQAPPKVVVYGPPLTAQQAAMLQTAYAGFHDAARVSVVRNPAKQGRLRDGSRYTIECSGESCTCTVWTEESAAQDKTLLKRGFVAVLDYLTGFAAGEMKAALVKVSGARLMWRKGGAWSVEDKKFRTGDSYLPYKVADPSLKMYAAAKDAEKVKTDIKGHADVVLMAGGKMSINTIQTSYKAPGGVPMLVGSSGSYSAYGVYPDRVLASAAEGGDVLVASTLDEKAKLTAMASVFSESFDCTPDMKTVSFFGVGHDLTSWHHWGVRAILQGGGEIAASTAGVKSRTWPGEVAISGEGAPFVSNHTLEWVGDTDDYLPDGHLGYTYTWSFHSDIPGGGELHYLQWTAEAEIKQTPQRKGETDVDTYEVSRQASKSIRAGYLNGSAITIDMHTSLDFSYKGENGWGHWATYWPGPIHNEPGEVHAAYFYGGGLAPGTGYEYSDGSSGTSMRRRYNSKSTSKCTVGGASVQALCDMTITQDYDFLDAQVNIKTRRAASAEGELFMATMEAVGHPGYSFAGGMSSTEVSSVITTKRHTNETWKVQATTRDYIYHCEYDKVSVVIRSEWEFTKSRSFVEAPSAQEVTKGRSFVEIYVDVVVAGATSSKKLHTMDVDIAGITPLTPLLAQLNNPWYHAAVVPPTPVFAPVACEQGDFPYIAHTTKTEADNSAPGLLLSLPLQLYFRIPDYDPPQPPRALSYYPIQMAKVWEAFGLISLHSLPFDLDKQVFYIQHDGHGLTQWTQPLVSEAGGKPDKASAEIYRT